MKKLRKCLTWRSEQGRWLKRWAGSTAVFGFGLFEWYSERHRGFFSVTIGVNDVILFQYIIYVVPEYHLCSEWVTRWLYKINYEVLAVFKTRNAGGRKSGLEIAVEDFLEMALLVIVRSKSVVIICKSNWKLGFEFISFE